VGRKPPFHGPANKKKGGKRGGKALWVGGEDAVKKPFPWKEWEWAQKKRRAKKKKEKRGKAG